jgi:hypothetical protein
LNRSGEFPTAAELIRAAARGSVGLRSSSRLGDLAFSLTLYSNQRSHHDEIAIRT